MRRPNLEDNLKGMWRSIRNGTAGNPLATRREILAAHDERVAGSRRYAAPSRRGGYYSKGRGDGSVDIFVGTNGDITAERPHVHIIHSSPEDRIIFKVTQRDGTHSHTEYLPSTASGNEVNAVVDRLRRRLR